ncbi:(Fe-S)-binding protein [Algibacter lectus]|uniref:L-lactate dehydrogenase complex protein LldE n=1 Tax=Algibacter lectus TaxID=221126 RepID=A0A090W136_9FLAO|nr:(Fe-S)-binding protein [Algibacter lectus]MWW25028.1 (Fe-S)-binding protein [Algibacter lectus]TDY64558.1 L-lactate dehydrogenase complex protein LldE [Algibacter lectus]GAL61247.1 predicted L-lactate dehydrogenase Fe-S oxidoreductase subunit YkgE [Algibacter lectus]SFD45699.1 L-lactate dehydrogenase complex protein LldE [Algibacter lectus]
MKVGLFIPCYINQLYPQVGKATLELLEKLKVDVAYPSGQTCCGQPMANSGYEYESVGACNNFVDNFKDFDYIVTPSGSCAYHVKKHYNIIPQTDEVTKVRNNVYELCDFILNILKVKDLGASFPFKVGVHKSCHGLRGLRLGSCSEVVGPRFSYIEELLQEVKGVELMPVKRSDECCGFGGTFAVTEEAISVKMGKDKIKDHLESGVEVMTATDTSCLMHLEGLVNRNQQPLKILHIAEILNSSL